MPEITLPAAYIKNINYRCQAKSMQKSEAKTRQSLVILVDETQQAVLAVDNDSGGNRNARLRFVILVASKYIIKATAVQGSGDINGSYKLTLTLGNPSTKSPVSPSGTPQIAALKPGADITADLSDNTPFR